MISTESKATGFKHREVTKALRREIDEGRWATGERLPGEQDLARHYEVAHMTMRQAIASLVEDGRLHRVRGKGTYVIPQEAKAGAPSPALHRMALIFPGDAQLMDPYYFPEVLHGFQQYMDDAGLNATIHSGGVAETLRILDPGSAVAFLLFEEPQLPVIESLRDNGYRVLAINRYPGRRSIPSVRINDAKGVEGAVDHLVSLGHERIGFISGIAGNLDAEERLRGFRGAVKRHALKAAPEAGEGFKEAAGYTGARKLLAMRNRPTALVCASDLAALGVIKAARDCGLSVPRGLSVVGFGDFSVADYMLPGLTTVRQSRSALGKAAAEQLIMIANDQPTTDILLDADLIIRESTSEIVK